MVEEWGQGVYLLSANQIFQLKIVCYLRTQVFCPIDFLVYREIWRYVKILLLELSDDGLWFILPLRIIMTCMAYIILHILLHLS